MGRPLWREDGSVVYNCCWPSPARLFSGLSPAGLMTIFYCLGFAWRAGFVVYLRQDGTENTISKISSIVECLLFSEETLLPLRCLTLAASSCYSSLTLSLVYISSVAMNVFAPDLFWSDRLSSECAVVTWSRSNWRCQVEDWALSLVFLTGNSSSSKIAL
jgi:hypothetical protein